jgi:hypothetical protein
MAKPNAPGQIPLSAGHVSRQIGQQVTIALEQASLLRMLIGDH